MKLFIKLFIIIISAGSLLISTGCEQNSPMSSISLNDEGSKPAIKILKLNNSKQAFNKKVKKEKNIKKSSGGSVIIEFGDSLGSMRSFLYGNSLAEPYNIYKIDPFDVANPQLVGQLAFSSAAIALHPASGLVYYVGNTAVNGVYPVATWDPSSNASTVLPMGSSFKPVPKLAFAPDGTLYGLYAGRLYIIDTSSGEWAFFKKLSSNLGGGGDIAFDLDGSLYAATTKKGLQSVDLISGVRSTIGLLPYAGISGLSFSADGQLYVSRKNGKLYSVDKATASTTLLGDVGIDYQINDLAPVMSHAELIYAYASLEIVPGSISEDVTISLELETTELSGGVSFTFHPHGINFSEPAILNIEAQGVDFTGVNPNDVDIFYDNQENGQWEPMQRDDVLIDVDAGSVKVVNARLPHFSRYAIGAE